MSIDLERRIRNVTAVLGPTNTGKTHLAIERMVGHESGMIGLPLRLLAREVYDRVVGKVGADKVALITGEEKIKPERARFWVCTVEAMPRDVDVDFLAVDEIQLAADPDRGHVFTDRMLHARGRSETLLLGSSTMRDAISDLIPGCNFISRPRLSKLTYAGEKKITRLPKRSAIVAFSASEVYAIAELIRRQRGGAAVVLGVLSPRTRNAQVALYQSGDVDFLVATDAIGMGLNLDVDHVAFAATRKFDGEQYRELTPAELAQIGGRAGRHMNDGTFGITGNVTELPADVIERLETHTFDPIKQLQWRSRDLDFRSLDDLRESLRMLPREARLARARMADDVLALETLSADREITGSLTGRTSLQTLWDVCQIPDYRKISTANHAELVSTVFKFLMGPTSKIPEDWLHQQVAQSDRTDGDIDTLSTRLSHIRTWTFVSHRAEWLAQPEHWQQRTREIEDSLSDALHEQLTQRFVDRRTSALMKGMRDKDELTTEIADDGAIKVEDHYVGRLRGFRFEPDAQALASDVHGKASRSAAAHVLAKELEMRARRVAAAKNEAFKLLRTGRVQWRGEDIARLEPGEAPLKPLLVLLADEHLAQGDRERVQERLDTWLKDAVAERLKPLIEMAGSEDITGLGRGIAFRMTENFGALKRETVADDIKSLDQPQRSQLRKYGVRFGAFNIFLPPLLKPVASDMTLVMWALRSASVYGLTPDTLPEPPRAGLTSLPVDPALPEPYYRASGYHVCGPRAVRFDILERLADLIRPLLAWRPTEANPVPPKGATGDGAFLLIPEMMSILGCSSAEVAEVLKSLGFRNERRKVRPLVIPKSRNATADAATPATIPATPEAPADGVPAAAETSEVAAADAATSSPVSEPPVEPLAATSPVQPSSIEPATEAATAEPEPAAAAAVADHIEVMQPAIEAIASPSELASTEVTAAPAAADIAPVSAEGEVALDVAANASATEVAVIAEAASEAAAPAAATVEAEQFEEVWRPRRLRQQHHGRPQRQRRDEQASASRDRSRRGEAIGDRGTPAGPVAAGAPTVESGEDRDRKQHGDHANRDKDRQRDRGQHSGQHGAAGPNQGRNDRDRRDERGPPRENRAGDHRRGRDYRDDRKPKVASSGPPRRSGPDPDSPFAALSALKQQLEQRSKDRSS